MADEPGYLFWHYCQKKMEIIQRYIKKISFNKWLYIKINKES